MVDKMVVTSAKPTRAEVLTDLLREARENNHIRSSIPDNDVRKLVEFAYKRGVNEGMRSSTRVMEAALGVPEGDNIQEMITVYQIKGML